GPSEPATPAFSPKADLEFEANLGSPDYSIAVGRDNIIVANTGVIAFFDKTGSYLKDINGNVLTFTTQKFFERFLATTRSDDGGFNESNLNLYMDLPKPCDSPDWPQLYSGTGLCLAEFNDARVTYDRHSRRFFVVSHVRHRVYEGSTTDDPACSYIVLAQATAKDQGFPKCDLVKTNVDPPTCSVNDDRFCHLPR